MTRQRVNTVIVGQGLAGTTLAWSLRFSGQRVLVLDRAEQTTASRIAAGLMTPITGQRLVQSRRFEDFWTTAVAFYRRVEAATQTTLLDTRSMVRLFSSREERQLFAEKHERERPDFHERSANVVDESCFHQSDGGCEFPQAGRLNVPRYLDASRDVFQRDHGYLPVEIDPQTDLHLGETDVAISKLGLIAERLIFCQGFAASENPWCGSLRFDAAKGEILTVRIPGLMESRVIHRGIWMAALGEDLFLVGATYNRDRLDSTPTQAGREELCTRLRSLLKCPFEIVDHRAAVRPILQGKQPAIGLHPDHPQIGWFNGLGSKGSLQAPWFAERFARRILQNDDELATCSD